MKRRPSVWLALVVVSVLATLVLTSSSSSGQVQGGTGKARQSTPGLFSPPPNY
jgi:hypothetical protein